MATEIQAVQESELPEVQRFLLQVFHAPPDQPTFRLDALRWKAFDPHPEYSGPRSFVIRHQGRIVTHGMLAPMRLRAPDHDLSANCLMDWAADAAIPGVGVAIYQHLAKLADIQIAIGGSDDARRMLPLLGFRPRPPMRSYRLITSAWNYHLRAGSKDWKTPARLVRDWTRAGSARVDAGTADLRAQRVDRFEDSTPMPDPQIAGSTVSARTPAGLNYALRCPLARMEAWLLERSGETIGYFVLARLGPDCRIAELWIHSSSAEDWLHAAQLATETAGHRQGAGAVSTTVSAPVLQSALEQIGYRFTQEVPVFIKDRRRLVPPEQPLLLTMLENDAFYIA